MIKIKETIKRMMAARNLSFQNLADIYAKVTGKSMSQEKLIYRINSEVIHIAEMKEICEILGYGVVITRKGEQDYRPIGIIKDTITELVKEKGIMKKDLLERYNARTGVDFARQSYFNKIAKEILRMPELQETIDILGYEVQVIDFMRNGETIGVTEA